MAKDKSIRVERPASKNAQPGWFSRRHATGYAHECAQQYWCQRQADKASTVARIMTESLLLTPAQKLEKVEARLPLVGGIADSERDWLVYLIEQRAAA
ncbi:MAG: hypothetical protein H6797_03975 [Candidatus Nomurabacteria bacterium]|nr:MAG: hypothetical protein H6797_03975 [Candidatus Nomurabacteria bacterium]